ncbi:MAG: carbamoyltransferase C-terminal domain-containing protein [Candidatus Micrarchaeia archaeon]
MNVVGIYVGHNATACLVLNNRLACAISEEKFTNIKNTFGFPINSLEYIMREYGLSAQDIDCVAFSNLSNGHSLDWKRPPTMDESRRISRKYAALCALTRHVRGFHRVHSMINRSLAAMRAGKSQGMMRQLLKERFGFRDSQISFAHHHLAHAYAPLGFFNLQKTDEPLLVITQDGLGDSLSGTVGIYENGKYARKDETDAFDSVAMIYGSMTTYMGMMIMEHEYKIMGLAPYPSEKYGLELYERKFKDLASVDGGKVVLKHKTTNPVDFANHVLKERMYTERFDNMAFALQHFVEEKMAKYVLDNVRKYRIKKVVFGGGLFMNVKLNKKIQELDEIEQCFFMPSSGDESLALGSAFLAMDSAGEQALSGEVTYLGKEYSKDELEGHFSRQDIGKKYEISRHKDAEAEAASLLSEGKIVGRFCGRGEWGARSLGNRAILGDPSRLETVEVINQAVKSRDFWMPFAPSMLDSSFGEYALGGGKAAPYYMITSYDSTKKGQLEMKAALHRKDKTMRPNVVTKRHNARYHRLLASYRKKSGFGGALNTSLNIHGYPLVGFLQDLFFTMGNSGLEYAQCEDYIIRKKKGR